MSFHDAFVPLWAPQHRGSTLLRALERIFDRIAAAEEWPITNKEAQFSDVVRKAVTTGDFTDMECDICKELITQDSPRNYWWKEEHMAVETFCSHKFHGSCLWTWIQDPDRRHCPYCRRQFYFRNMPWELPIYRYCRMFVQHREPRLEHEQFLFRLAFMNELEIHPSELLYHLLEIHLQLRNWQYFGDPPNAFRQCHARATKFISKTRAALNIPNNIAPAPAGKFPADELRGYSVATLRLAADLLNELNAVVSHKNFEAYVQRFVESEDDLVMIQANTQPGADVGGHIDRFFIQHQNWNSPRYRIVARSPKVEYGPLDREEAYAKITKLLRQNRLFSSTRKRKNRKAFRRLELHMQNPESPADTSSRRPPSHSTGFDWLKALYGRWRQPKSAPPDFWSIFEGVPHYTAFWWNKRYSGGARKR